MKMHFTITKKEDGAQIAVVQLRIMRRGLFCMICKKEKPNPHRKSELQRRVYESTKMFYPQIIQYEYFLTFENLVAN